MRAPARIFGISFAVFLVLTLILSRFESETVTRTINKFPSIKQQFQARKAASQSHFSSSSSSSSSNAAACDADEKTCADPYHSKDIDNDLKPATDQSLSEYDEADAKDGKDRRPSSKDEDRDKDRGFTDAEQAAALERLEFKYGEEAKDKADKILWMETTTTNSWGADPTEALDSEAERARQRLGEEYGDLKATTTGTVDPEVTASEKGWRTTGFETKAKTTQKTLVSGGGGNGTATFTGKGTVTEAVTTSTKKGKKKPWSTEKAKAASTSSARGRWDD